MKYHISYTIEYPTIDIEAETEIEALEKAEEILFKEPPNLINAHKEDIHMEEWEDCIYLESYIVLADEEEDE